jgi:hypothetical protein
MKAVIFPFAIFIVITLLCSCNVEFVSPQPGWITKNEKEIPKKLRGTYFVKGKLLGDQKNDTIRIGEKRIFDNHDVDYTLSDSVLLKIYHHSYFLNLYNSEEKTWIIVMAKEEKKKNLFLFYLLTEDSTRLKENTKVNVISNDKVNINPSSEEFRKILKGNLFSVCDTLIRISSGKILM